MKNCVKCGALNKDDNNFCNSCGSPEFKPAAENTTAPGAAPVPPPPVNPVVMPTKSKPEFTMFDLFTIFGFVASIIGNFVIALVLEPLALAAAIAGFARGKRNRGLAIAAIVIAAIGLLIRFFITLNDNGIIPEWMITGTLDN